MESSVAMASDLIIMTCVQWCSINIFSGAVTPLSLLSKDLEQRRADEEDQCCVQPNVEGGTTGVRSVDIVLIQHLLHCEFLLQHLQVM